MAPAQPDLDPIYTDPLLTALYDALNPAGDDSEFYLRCAGANARVLDIGCGTGLLTRLFAVCGHVVTGVEPAAAMLDIARRHDPEGLVDWIEADARRLALARRFDLAIMSGHVFQVFSAEDALAVLEAAFAHLKDGGRLVFDSRNPLRKPWRHWTPEASRRRIVLADVGAVDIHHRVVAIEGEWVSFESIHAFRDAGLTRTSASRLRFPPASEIAALLREAGFAAMEFYGDWNAAPYGPESAEIIAVATRS